MRQDGAAGRARQFNERLVNACIRAHSLPGDAPGAKWSVVIVGGGATGVELAAELHSAARVLSSCGMGHVNPQADMRNVLIEAAPRLLSQLPERLGHAAVRELRKLAIEVHTGETVVEVTAHSVKTQRGTSIDATVTASAPPRIGHKATRRHAKGFPVSDSADGP